SGTYCPTLALNILDGLSTYHVQIDWSGPAVIWQSGSVGQLTGDAITANAAGTFMMIAAGTTEAGTIVLEYQTSNGTWVSANPGTVLGNYPQFSFGGAAA